MPRHYLIRSSDDRPDVCVVETESPVTPGKISSMELPVSHDRVDAYISGRDRRLVQQQFPDLSAEQREFLMTGYTPEEWGRVICSINGSDDQNPDGA